MTHLKLIFQEVVILVVPQRAVRPNNESRHHMSWCNGPSTLAGKSCGQWHGMIKPRHMLWRQAVAWLSTIQSCHSTLPPFSSFSFPPAVPWQQLFVDSIGLDGFSLDKV